MSGRVYHRFEEEGVARNLNLIPTTGATSGIKRKRPFPPESTISDHAQTSKSRLPSAPRDGAFQQPAIAASRHAQPNLKQRAAALDHARKALPIWSHAAEIRDGLREKNVMLIVGETGSGKSTQVPQMLVEEPWCKRQQVTIASDGVEHEPQRSDNGQQYQNGATSTGKRKQTVNVGGCIAITEPRKVAAISLAERVAAEMGTPLGSSSPASKVGFSVRFNQSVSQNTQIKFLTEGTLLQEMLRDPWLRKYSAVVLDEVHERGLNVDLLLGFLRGMVGGKCEGRGGVGLKVVVMSATAEMEGLRGFFEEGYQDSRSQEVQLSTGLERQHGLNHCDDLGADQDDDHDMQVDEELEWSGFLSSDVEDEPTTPLSEDNLENMNEFGEPLDRRKAANISKPAHNLNHTNGALARSSPQNFDKESQSPTASRTKSTSPVSTVHVEGRQYPVTTHYTPSPVSNWLTAALELILRIHTKEPLPGDILVFLTGQETVESLLSLIHEHSATFPPGIPDILPLPLFAALPQDAQQAIFKPPPRHTRKVILATNIAETSVTVPGVRFVIDSGKAKIKHFRTNIGLESLLVKPISKSAATQRQGRAGREAPGQCWRLYTEADYLELQHSNTPEILRCDLSSAILTIQARGIRDIYTFPFLDRPRRDAYEKALAHLHQLFALDQASDITEIGLQMARLPLSASLARTLLASAQPETNCIAEVIDIIACLSVENIFLKTSTEDKKEEAETARRSLYRREGDHLTLLATVQAYLRENTDRKEWCRRCWVSHRAMRAVMDVRKQLRALPLFAKELDSSVPSSSTDISAPILKAFVKGFASNTALRRQDGSYKTLVGGQKVAIHPSSVLFGKHVEAILFNEFVFTNKAYARGVSAVDQEWLGDAWREPDEGI